MTKDVYLVHAKGAAIETAADDIQLMPPGTHTITPMGPDGKAREVTVTVNAKTAEAMEAARREYQAKADAGTEDAPFFDFNHEDGEASAWPKEIYWAGDDPLTGGVRAKVEWSQPGREAVEGKSFRRFSPAFYISKSGEITGAPVNMGGLVNRAAFKTIQAFFAKDNPTMEKTMNEDDIKAMQAENADLKARLKELEEKHEAQLKANAEREVDEAVKAGRLADDKGLRAKWVDTLLTSPNGSALLASLPKNPVLDQTRITGAAPGKDAEALVQAKDGKPMEGAELLKAYEAIPDREGRQAFYEKNKPALLKAAGK